MNRFDNRVALITGACGGIGRQFVRLLAAEGASIAALDLQESALAELRPDVNGRPLATAVADVTNREQLLDAVGQVEKQLGPTDLLIANAGIGLETTAEGFSARDFEAQIRVNLIGVANSIEAVLPQMLQRRRGHIVGISSLASYRGLPKMFGYCASKAGLNAMLDGIRLEVQAHGITVTTICPGWIRTPLTNNVDVPKPYMMDAEYAVRKMVDAIGKKKTFIAFPPQAAWQVRILGWLPAGISDPLIRILLRKLMKRTPPRTPASSKAAGSPG